MELHNFPLAVGAKKKTRKKRGMKECFFLGGQIAVWVGLKERIAKLAFE